MATPLDPRDPRNRDDSPPQRSVGPVRDDPPGHQDQQQPQRPEHLPPQRPANDYPQRDRQQQPDQREQHQPEERNHPRSLPPLSTESYGPVAPEPAWEPPPRSFDRERFLLHCFAAALIAQYAVFTAGVYLCNNAGIMRLQKGLPLPTPEQNRNCLQLGDKLDNTFELSISTILALLAGGGAALLKAKEDPRRKQ